MRPEFKTEIRELSWGPNLPHLGQRIVKTTVAVFLCMVINSILSDTGTALQSAVTAIICMQAYRETIKRVSIDRMIGTLIGGLWGMICFLAMRMVDPQYMNYYMAYFLMALGVMFCLYTCVVMKHSDTAALATIVFISIVGSYPNVENPVVQTMYRMFETFIGIFIAWAVDSVKLPRKKHPEYFFFMDLSDLVPDRLEQPSQTLMVMLNRLLADGARISLATEWAPAFLMSQMGMMGMNTPVVLMDGAVVYDMNTGQYKNAIPIDMETYEKLGGILKEAGVYYCTYTIRNRSMLIYMNGMRSPMEEMEYNIMKKSPYRNYVPGAPTEEDEICFVRILSTNNRVDILQGMLKDKISKLDLRMERRWEPAIKNSSGLYFYNSAATVEKQQEYIVDTMVEEGMDNIVPYRIQFRKSGVPTERDSVGILHRVKNIYEPVSLIPGTFPTHK